MTIKQILDMTAEDVSRLNKQQLRAALRSVVDANNKAIRRLQDKGIETEALIARAKRVGADSTGSRDLLFTRPRGNKQTVNAMRSQLREAVGYARSKTGRVSGFTASVKSFEREVPGISRYIGQRSGDLRDEGKAFWNMYHKFLERNPNARESPGGTNEILGVAVKQFQRYYKGEIKTRTFFSNLKRESKAIYERQMEELGNEEFFEV